MVFSLLDEACACISIIGKGSDVGLGVESVFPGLLTILSKYHRLLPLDKVRNFWLAPCCCYLCCNS